MSQRIPEEGSSERSLQLPVQSAALLPEADLFKVEHLVSTEL